MNLKFDIEKVIKSKTNLNVARKYHEIDNVERIDIKLANHAKINQELAEMLKMDQPNDLAILAMLTRLRQLCIEPSMIYEIIELYKMD